MSYLGVEIKVGDEWLDITEDVSSKGVSVKRGRPDEGGSLDPSRMSLELRNSDGKYSPRNARSPLFGFIGRNTPIRSWVEDGETRLVQNAGSQFYTDDSTALDITGDLDLRVDITMRTWRPANSTWLGVLKHGAYGLLLLPNGAIRLEWNSPVGNNAISTVPIPGGISGRKAIRVTLDVNNGSGNHEIKFYRSDSMVGIWEQFGGTVVKAGTTAITATGQFLTTYTTESCEIFGMEIRNGIGGAVVASVSPSTVPPGSSTVADGHGNTWKTSSGANITNRNYLFTGEVTSWPQKWGKTGAPSAYSPVECSGVLRRLGQGASPVKSTLRRGTENLPALAGYWPLEDGKRAVTFSAMPGLPGRTIGTVSPSSYSGFVASDPIPTLGSGRIYLALNTYQPTGQAQVRFLMNLASAPDDGTVFAQIGSSSSLGRIDLEFDAGSGGFRAKLYDNAGVLGFVTGVLAVNLIQKDMRLSIEVKQNGGDVNIRLVAHEEGYPNGYYLDFTKTGLTLGAITYVYLNPTGVDLSASVGHVSVEKVITSLFELASQYTGYNGERADVRMARLAEENNLQLSVIGAGAGCERMGPQQSAELLELMSECEAADHGVLFEERSSTALRYRTLESLWGQDPVFSMPFGDGSIFDMEPVDDDQGTRNVVTVARKSGGEYTAVVDTGPLNRNPPPDGVGVYDESITLNVATDAATMHQAGWRAHMGTVDEARWPVIGLNLAHPLIQADAKLTRQLLSVDIGDVIEITDLPSWLPPFPVRQLVLGSTVEVWADSSKRRINCKIEWNCVPASPYRVGTWVSSGYVASNSPTVLLSETFSGSAGSAVSSTNWANGLTGTAGASATIQGGKGRWLTGTGSGYDFAAKAVSRRAIIASRADLEFSGFYTPQGECYPKLCIRAADTVFDGGSGYDLVLPTQGGFPEMRLYENSVAYAGNVIGSYALPAASGVTYGVRLRAVGSQIQARIWNAADSEPATWHINVSNSAISEPGETGLVVAPGDAAGSYVDWDDVLITTGVSSSVVYQAPSSRTRWSPGVSALAMDINNAQEIFNVSTTVGPRWTTNPAEFPFGITIGGEAITVMSISGETSTQTFTVIRAVNGVSKSHLAGSKISLTEEHYWGARPSGGTQWTNTGTVDPGTGTVDPGTGTVDPGTGVGAAAARLFGAPISGYDWHSGSWTSTMMLQRAQRWGTWRGAPNDFATVYPAYGTWEEMADSSWLFGLDATTGIGMGGFTGVLNLGLPLLPTNDPGNWAAILNGSKDSVFLSIAQAAHAAGFSSRMWVRLGIEVNGDWFPSQVTWANAENYRLACQRIVGIFRSVSTGFKFGPDISAGTLITGAPGGTTPAQVLDALWPGDAYCDGWGIDTYDHWHIKVPDAASFANHLRPTQGIGIGHVADWLRAHGNHDRVLVLPEWGCSNQATVGGGDNPIYIQQMHAWFKANLDVLAAEAYFNEPFANVLNSLWLEFGDPQQCPNAGAAYLSLFNVANSSGGGTTTTQQPNTVRIGTATYPLSGVNPGSVGGWGGDQNYPGYRGPDQILAYTQPAVAVTATHQWGAEVPADADYLINSINDRQTTQDTAGTPVPSPGGVVLSGHGLGRDFLLNNASTGSKIELLYVAPVVPGGGGGTTGGGTGGNTTPYPAAVVTVYKMSYANNIPFTAVPSTASEIRLSFAFDSSSGVFGLSWGGSSQGYTSAGQAAMVSTLADRAAAGQRIILSLGGGGNPFSFASAQRILDGIASIASLLSTNGVTFLGGIDWDIEVGSSFPTSLAVSVSTQCKSIYGSGFAITMAPNGTNVGNYLPAAVQLHQANALDSYGQQFYDYNYPVYADIRSRVNEAIGAGLPASKISIGFALTSPNPLGYWSQANALSAMQQARSEFGIRKAYLWVEDSLYTNGQAATWINNAKSALGA